MTKWNELRDSEKKDTIFNAVNFLLRTNAMDEKFLVNNTTFVDKVLKILDNEQEKEILMIVNVINNICK